MPLNKDWTASTGAAGLRVFYEPEEYMGAEVYDRLGFLYGRVCGVELEERVALKACIVVEAETPIPDVDRLRAALAGKGVELGPDAGVEALVAAARRVGVEVPYTLARSRVELVKGTVEPGEILVVDETGEGSLVVLLGGPREAEFRGLGEADLAPPKPRDLIGKPVISLSRGYLGKAEKIVIGPGGYGIRAVKKLNPYIAWLAFIRRLEERGHRALAKKLIEEVADPLSSRRLPASQLPRLRSLLASIGAPREAIRLLESSIQYERVERNDVEAAQIVSAADAVIAS